MYTRIVLCSISPEQHAVRSMKEYISKERYAPVLYYFDALNRIRGKKEFGKSVHYA